MPTTALRTCLPCEATCGLVLELEDDRITRVTGGPEHPLRRGYLCPRGAALGELDHDPDRVTAPRVRTGGTWRDVSWDDAFAFIDERLRAIDAEHGRQSVGMYLGNPNVHTLSGQLYTLEQSVATARPGVNVNVLVDTVTMDPLSGTAGLTAVPVQVGPV